MGRGKNLLNPNTGQEVPNPLDLTIEVILSSLKDDWDFAKDGWMILRPELVKKNNVKHLHTTIKHFHRNSGTISHCEPTGKKWDYHCYQCEAVVPKSIICSLTFMHKI
jgi:hypothetical protein